MSDSETFWIASQYLEIPSEIFPKPKEEETWYQTKLNFFKQNPDKLTYTFEEFNEIKNCARHVYKNEQLKNDVVFWLDLIKEYAQSEVISLLKQKATYEYLIIKYVGLRTLEKDEPIVTSYLDWLFSKSIQPIDMEDLSIVLTHVNTAFKLNSINLDKKTILRWNDKLIELLNKQLAATKDNNTKCILLETIAFTKHTLAIFDTENDGQSYELRLKESAKWYKKILNIAANAPLYSLETLCNRLNDFIEIFNNLRLDTTEYDNLARKAENLLAKKHGDFIAAEKSQDRAILYFKSENYVKAIEILHDMKIKWFSGEKIKLTIITALTLSESYQRIGMNYAAKYYALVAAHIITNNTSTKLYEYLPKSVFLAANSDYLQGCWFGYLNLSEFGIIAYSQVMKDFDFDKDEDLLGLVYHTSIINFFSNKFNLSINDILIKWGNIKGYVDRLTQEADEAWKKLDDKDFIDMLKDTIVNAPFNDLGLDRVIKWEALGLKWKLFFKNEYNLTSAVEQFAAIVQILIVDFVDSDLCILPTNINILIEESANETIELEPCVSNDGRFWKIYLPQLKIFTQESKNESQAKIFKIVTEILLEVSLLPEKKISQILKQKVKKNLFSKIFIADSYELIYRKFISEENFNLEFRVNNKAPHLQNYTYKTNQYLNWLNVLGPTYSISTSKKLITNRYLNSQIPIKHTLEKYKHRTEFKAIIDTLRKDGWKDWLILMSIANIASQYRANKIYNGKNIDHKKEMEEYMKIFTKPESKDDIIPFSIINIKSMQESKKMMMLSSLVNWKLELKQITPDLPAIEKFLKIRYKYFEDDINHIDPFV